MNATEKINRLLKGLDRAAEVSENLRTELAANNTEGIKNELAKDIEKA